MKKILFTLLAATFALGGCQNDDGGNGSIPGNGNGNGGGGEETPATLDDLKPNTLVLNGEELPLAKIFVEDYSGVVMVTATSVAEAESFDWIIDNGAEYVQMLAIPGLCNREFDPMTETEIFSLFSTYAEAPLMDGVGPGVTEALESGRCRLDFDGETGEMFLDLKLADGSTIAARAAGAFVGTAPDENIIERNGDKKPLRASFYSVEDGMGLFYFTPAEIDYFEEIDLASYYVLLMVDESLIDSGETVDVNNSSAFFEIYYVDNLSGDMQIVSAEDPAGAQGTFSIARLDGADSFAASMSMTFSEELSVSLVFEGACKDMYAEPEKANEFVFDGEASPIASVVIDQRPADLWVVWLSAQSGVETAEAMEAADAVKISAPEAAFSGEPVGFSTYKNMSIAFRGTEWNYGNGSLGTLTASIDEGTITLEFTNYDNLKGYYTGPAVIVQ